MNGERHPTEVFLRMAGLKKYLSNGTAEAAAPGGQKWRLRPGPKKQTNEAYLLIY
jgi:hypothetical protein